MHATTAMPTTTRSDDHARARQAAAAQLDDARRAAGDAHRVLDGVDADARAKVAMAMSALDDARIALTWPHSDGA